VTINDVLARVGEIRARLELPPLRTNFAPPATSAAAPIGSTPTGTSSTGFPAPATSATDFEATLANLTGQIPQPAGTGMMSSDPDLGKRMAEYGVNFVGVPYVAGGNTPESGWDCAAFTEWIAKQHGLSIPPVSWEQIKVGEPVASLGEARAGDLVFFHEPSGHSRDPSPLKVNHVGIYLGDGRMVEASNPTSDTRISEVSVEKLVGIRRLAGPLSG
jgi:cell wall-associated NlpC family hydrolase